MKAALTKAVKSTVIPVLVGLLGVVAVALPGAFIVRSVLDGSFLGNIETLNQPLWVIGNLLAFYICAVMTAFVSGYGLFFHWRQTRGGKDIFYFTLSLLGVMFLFTIGILTSKEGPWVFPGDIIWFRPLLRVLVYGLVAVAVTRLFATLTIRYFRPTSISLDVLPKDHTTRLPGSLRAVPRPSQENGSDRRTPTL